jgi:histidyl-tRNA synthetase
VVGGSEEGRAGLEELAAIGAALDAMGVGEDRALVDPSVVRGLEYYTGPVFEAELLMETADERGTPVAWVRSAAGGTTTWWHGSRGSRCRRRASASA